MIGSVDPATWLVGLNGDDREFANGLIQSLRVKLSSPSEFVRKIKVLKLAFMPVNI